MAIRFRESDVRPMGRGAAGVKGIELSVGDVVVDMAVLDPAAQGQILTVTELGYGKRTEREAYRLQGRGGKGVTNIRTTEKNGLVVGILYVTEDDQVLLITKNGKIIRTSCGQIRSVGRATQGVTVINIEPEDAVVAAVKVVERDDEGGNGAEELSDGEEGADSPETDDSVN
jgi:DNA gyrase subunit A